MGKREGGLCYDTLREELNFIHELVSKTYLHYFKPKITYSVSAIT